MNVHEYQAKELFMRYGVPVPPFVVVETQEEVQELIQKKHLQKAVLKIQVHAGGRGKAGGVVLASSPEEIELFAKKLLGMNMVNLQTGPLGVVARKLLITEPKEIHKEYYLAAVIDRTLALPILMASLEGGMEIEEVASKCPEKILRIPIELNGEIKPFRLIRLLQFMGWQGQAAKQGTIIAKALAKAFIESDASLLEINPLIEDDEGLLWALDAKLSIDENALFRQTELAGLYDPTQQSLAEARAKAFDLAYVAMDGNIGCMVNGAGLAMATMDLIHFYGGKPANFLDVGGGASKEKIAAGFQIIAEDPKVQVILVNIFGGIMNCAVIAEGILAACKEGALSASLVVRMEGTAVEEGRRILLASGLPIETASTLQEAAEKATTCLRRKSCPF